MRESTGHRRITPGDVVVVDEAYKGYVNPVYWVGVVEEFDAAGPELPIVRLTRKPARLSDWWVIGKAYQHERKHVLTLEEARERFGDQPEFETA
ncbi:hypothetical protein [Actinocorallia libanotica]|uniref:Uncharacterized protein n=1 Tax=Actinocorallia libanotica TaxID=46162 RepID=A0ABN1Q1I7_9ACTN